MSELARILALPRRQPVDEAALVRKWTERLGKPGAPPLYPHQALAIEDAVTMRGGFFGLGVGDGKTLLAMLLPTAMGLEGKAILLLPSALVEQAKRDHLAWSKWYPVEPPKLVAYSTLSTLKRKDLLEVEAPELIICDEAHNLGNATAARTKRFLAYMTRNLGANLVTMSGSFGPGIDQYYHLAAIALGEDSPVPLRDIGPWVQALNIDSTPDEGLLRSFTPLTRWAGIQAKSQRDYRRAYQARITDAPGMLWSDSADLPVKLYLQPWTMPLSPAAQVAVAMLETQWMTPSYQKLISASEVQNHAVNVPYGIYQDWDWAAVGGYNEPWDMARKAWLRELSYLRNEGVSDSVAELEGWASARRLRARSQRVYDAWEKQRATAPFPPERSVIYDQEQVDALRRAVEALPPGTLVWYTSRAMAAVLNGVLDVYGAGQSAPTNPARSAAVSAHVFGTGWHAVDWCHSLILQPNLGVRLWQQLLGRTHRTGQQRDVTVEIAASTRALARIFWSARRKAAANEDLHLAPQKLVRGELRDFCGMLMEDHDADDASGEDEP